MVSLASYRLHRVPLPEVALGHTYVFTLGAGLYDLDGQAVMSVVEDDSGRSIVIGLTPEQAAQARALLGLPLGERIAAVQAWMASAELADNEVLGCWRDYLLVAIGHLARPDH